MTSPEPWRRIVARIEAAATPLGRASLGQVSLEGLRLFERALRAGARVEAAVVSDEFLRDESPRARALRMELDRCCAVLEPVGDDVMRALTDGRTLGGLVGLARLPRPRTLDEVLTASSPAPKRLLVGVALNDPGNVGALVRTAHASGAAALCAVGATDAFHPKAVRTSMGSVFRLPVLAWPELDALLAELRAAGVRTLGAVTEGGTPLPRVHGGAGPVALVLGSEAIGLSEAQRAALDELVTIPMAPGVDSLSVNAAAAVALYQLGLRDC